jgi:hypothetical protein
MARQSKLTEKDMSVLREGDATVKQSKQTRGVLRDYSLNHRVEMQWDLNEETQRDMMFKLIIDDIEVILDWEEMMRYGRWI